MVRKIEWRRTMSSYSDEELVRLEFETDEEHDSAIKLSYSSKELSDMPRRIVGMSLIVPQEAEAIFRREGLRISKVEVAPRSAADVRHERWLKKQAAAHNKA